MDYPDTPFDRYKAAFPDADAPDWLAISRQDADRLMTLYDRAVQRGYPLGPEDFGLETWDNFDPEEVFL